MRTSDDFLKAPILFDADKDDLPPITLADIIDEWEYVTASQGLGAVVKAEIAKLWHTIEVSLTDLRKWHAEIERLRTALETIADDPNVDDHDTRMIALAALGRKK